MRFPARPRPITFVNARVVGPDGEIASSLRVERGRVADLDAPPRSRDVVVDLSGAPVLPGLINAHDHLELNNFPRLKWRDHYTNVREWIADFQPRFRTDPALIAATSCPLGDRLLAGGLKNLLSGVTTVCHHNPLYPQLRRDFPVRVVTRYGFSHSLLIDGAAVRTSYRRTPHDWPWIIHAAEGTDGEAAGELAQLDRMGCLASNTILVHGVGLRAEDHRRLIDAGGALVWCPASNAFLLGATAEVHEFARAGRLALGSDSRLSGARDLLAELRVAREDGKLTGRELVRMMTSSAAAILRLPHAGRIAPGLPADVTIFPPVCRDLFDSVLAATRSDLRLTMIAGRPLVGDLEMAPVFAAAYTRTRAVRVDSRDKLIARAIADRVRRSSISEPGLAFGN